MQAENFHTKKWFQQDEASHGYNGLLDNEPHDLVCCVEITKHPR
jgi:hypothetical protein